MKMKNKILKLSLFTLIITLGACKKNKTIEGSGNLISQTRILNSFDEIISSGSATVNVIYGTFQKVEVRTDDNVMGYVQTRVNNSVLTLELEGDYNYQDVTLTFTITIPNLSHLKNSGSGSFNVSGFNNLSSLSINNSGSGTITLSGSSTGLAMANSGSGKLHAFNFITQSCNITNSGSGVFEVYCTDYLTSKNSGSGTIYYKGYPSITSTNSGSGSIIDAN